MAPWRKIHRERFASLLSRLDAALHPDAASVSASASIPESTSAPAPEPAAEAAGMPEPEAVEGSADTAPAMSDPPAAADAGTEVSNAIEAKEEPFAPEAEPPYDEALSDATTPTAVEPVDPIDATETDKPAPSDAATRTGEVTTAHTRSAREFFASIPWGAVQSAEPTGSGEPKPTVPPPSGDEAAAADTDDRPSVPPVQREAPDPARTSQPVTEFLQRIPWSGDGATASFPESDEGRLRIASEGVDLGRSPDEAPSQSNLLMAGLRSAAKTSKRMQHRDSPGETATETGEDSAAIDPSAVGIVEFLNTITWKQKAL